MDLVLLISASSLHHFLITLRHYCFQVFFFNLKVLLSSSLPNSPAASVCLSLSTKLRRPSELHKWYLNLCHIKNDDESKSAFNLKLRRRLKLLSEMFENSERYRYIILVYHP